MQPDRPMMEVQTDHGPEMREMDRIDRILDSTIDGDIIRNGERHPVLRPGEMSFSCIDGTVYVVKGPG